LRFCSRVRPGSHSMVTFGMVPPLVDILSYL
jgi:hypothetical protein